MCTTINAPDLKLNWKIKEIFDDLPTIIRQLELQIDKIPENKINDRKKLTNWIDQTNAINKEVKNIKQNKITELEKNLQYTFNDQDLVVLMFVQPSFKKLFEELNNYYRRIGLHYDFRSFLNLNKTTKVLALIGDAAIDLALIHDFWQPGISNVEQLTKHRSKVASNENLARICDEWSLYELRIPNNEDNIATNKKTINHQKGTIIEALFGIIYLESGLEKVGYSIDVLK